MSSYAFISVVGHVLIKDKNTNEVVLNKKNAVHPQNMALALARGLANQNNNQIYRIKLGNGGSSVDSLNQIYFLPPNISSSSATLYNETYSEIVDSADINAGLSNSTTVLQSPAPENTSIVVVSATIGAAEPAGQSATDADPQATNQYAFDELGLFTADDKLLTHIVFAPILKTANRELVVTYTLTISVS